MAWFLGAARMIQIEKHVASLLFSAALVTVLGGCSTLEKHIPGMGAASPETRASATAAGVYYIGSADLPLYRSPGGVIVKQLPQYSKVHREQLDRGFARVRVDATGETGWVENAQLIWRLPKALAPQAADAAVSQAVAETPSPAAVDEAPSSALPQAPEPTPPAVPQAGEAAPSPAVLAPSSASSKRTVAPSIFDPY